MKTVSLLLGSLALVACDGPGTSCVRGTTQVCNCTATLMGVQICGDDGAFGACACDGFDGGPVGADGGAPIDGGEPSPDAGADAGMTHPACSCTWGGTIMGGADTSLFVLGVSDSGDLVYTEDPDGADDKIVQVRGCMGAMQTVRAVDVGSAPGNMSVRAILPGDVLVLAADPAPNGELVHVVFWDVRTRAVLQRIDTWFTATLSHDGRGHVLLAYQEDTTSPPRVDEYDPRGTLLRDLTAQVPDLRAVVEPLAEGWLVRSAAGEPQLLLEGSLSPSSRPLPPASDFLGRAGTPFVEGRRFVTNQEIVDSTTVRYHFSEIDLASAVIWDGVVEMETTGGRGYGCGAAVMTPTGGWRGCTVYEAAALPPLGAPSVSTAYLVRFDPETGERLATIPYATSDTRHCDYSLIISNVVSDGCGASTRRCQLPPPPSPRVPAWAG
ncbi:MAG: hypothetical protein M5U28_50845 [Sandaracinaceae bacterium]|nr:hypothetical protein [Sandaracinaceae bacterium]